MTCKKCVNGSLCGGIIVDHFEKDANGNKVIIESCSKCGNVHTLDPIVLSENFPTQRSLSGDIFPQRNHLQYRLV